LIISATDFGSNDPNEPFLLNTEEHKLAVAFWCIPGLAKYAFQKFVELNNLLIEQSRLGEQKLKLFLNKVSVLKKKLLELIFSKEAQSVQLLIRCTRVLLLINADSYTALNTR
jgi:hypothetical protein